LIKFTLVRYNRDSVRYNREERCTKILKTNQRFNCVHYKREFVITEFVITEFDCSNNMEIEYSKVPEHIGHVVERNEGIIDGDHLKALLESSTHNQTSNTPETVDAYIVKVTSFILLDFIEINRT
jgi:hypothetical protein